jgi:23S rRNA (adenine-N6)-dimethyltransferase
MPANSSARRQLPLPPDDSRRLSHSQNFITDEDLIERLLHRVDLGQADTVIEIGPGRGALTAALLRLGTHVIAVEADTRLIITLLERFGARRKITLVHGDFLEYPLPARPFVVVANIPFNCTADIVRKLTSEASGLHAAYLIMQKEAAQKLAGQPACASHLLAHFLRLDYTVDYLCDIPRACFSPRPRVDIAFALICKRKLPLLDPPDARLFRDLLSYLFGCTRPLLRDALGIVFSHAQVRLLFQSLRLDHASRVGTTVFNDWLAILRVFAKHASPAARSRIQDVYVKLLSEQATLKKRHRTSRN